MAEAKRPVGGAFGAFLNEKRDAFKKEAVAAGDTSFGAVGKMASVAWKAMDDKAKAVYQKQYEDAAKKFQEYKASDAYVAPEKHDKREKKPVKDADAPKKLVGGAYGVFMNERRAEFTAQAAATGDKSFGGGAKLASAAWKGLAEAEKAKFEERFQGLKRKYEEDFAAYNASKPEVDTTTVAAESPVKAKSPGRPRKAAKTDANAKKPTAAAVQLDAALLEVAQRKGLKAALENLAARSDIVAAGLDGAKLLDALGAANGLVNKAKAALLGA